MEQVKYPSDIFSCPSVKAAAFTGIPCGVLLNGLTVSNKQLPLFRRWTYGGVIGGMFFVTYTGVHNWLAEKRGVYDAYNFSVAGSAAVATVIHSAPGLSPSVRASLLANRVPIAARAATLSFLLGLAQLKLLKKVEERAAAARGLKIKETREIKHGDDTAVRDWGSDGIDS